MSISTRHYKIYCLNIQETTVTMKKNEIFLCVDMELSLRFTKRKIKMQNHV